MSSQIFCLHYKFGFCKYGDRCWKKHIDEKCETQECDGSSCDKRHPRPCKYYRLYKRCKFGDYCAFDHFVPVDPVLEELKLVKAKLLAVEKEIETNNSEMLLVLRRLEDALNSQKFVNLEKTAAKVVPSNSASTTLPVTPSMPTITMVNSDPLNISQGKVSLGGGIPQLDGVSTSSFKCDNCGVELECEKELENHDQTHQFGCDDCFLCFTSKFLADLHQLEKHPGTSYARDHIPSTTKMHFASKFNSR